MRLPSQDIKAFLDAAPDAMVIVNADGRIAFVNAQAESMFGCEHAVLVGESVDILLPERFRRRHAGHRAEYMHAAAARPMGARLNLLAMRRDGSEFPVEISLSPVPTSSGLFVSSAIRDITDRKLVEQALIESREAAEQANRAKSTFLAAASHDLRQPLQTLTLLSSVLSRAVPGDSQAATAVAGQAEALRSMAKLINALLDISKLEVGVIKPDVTDCRVSSIFAGLRAEFAALAEAKGLMLHVEDNNEVVRTDPTLLREILQNLLANAIRYTRTGWVQLRGLTGETCVRIEILDSGVGIAADQLSAIFDDFYQVPASGDRQREGLGLGLSIVRRIASLLGHALEVHSAEGNGSSFTVSVPRSGAAWSADASPAVYVAPRVAGNARVLVIDDDAAVADATALLLRTMGFDAVVTHGPEQALRIAADGGRAARLIICDYHLGRGCNGLDTIRAIRHATRQPLPAILISGDTSRRVTEGLNGMDGCHLLSKPVDPNEMMDLVLRLVVPDNA